MKKKSLEPRFVEFVPAALEPGILYVSITYATASHLCACGCGSKVVTPIKPSAWELTFNGETVSLYPSIGNFRFPCRSHYWITDNQVEWAPDWSDAEVERSRMLRKTESERIPQNKSPTLSRWLRRFSRKPLLRDENGD